MSRFDPVTHGIPLVAIVVGAYFTYQDYQDNGTPSKRLGVALLASGISVYLSSQIIAPVLGQWLLKR